MFLIILNFLTQTNIYKAKKWKKLLNFAPPPKNSWKYKIKYNYINKYTIFNINI